MAAHARADLCGQGHQRALYYDLVDRGEERMARWPADVRCRVGRRILRHGRRGAGEGRTLNKPILKSGPVVIGAPILRLDPGEARFDVPPGLYDPNVILASGDPAPTSMLEIAARERSRCGRLRS